MVGNNLEESRLPNVDGSLKGPAKREQQKGNGQKETAKRERPKGNGQRGKANGEWQKGNGQKGMAKRVNKGY